MHHRILFYFIHIFNVRIFLYIKYHFVYFIACIYLSQRPGMENSIYCIWTFVDNKVLHYIHAFQYALVSRRLVLFVRPFRVSLSSDGHFNYLNFCLSQICFLHFFIFPPRMLLLLFFITVAIRIAFVLLPTSKVIFDCNLFSAVHFIVCSIVFLVLIDQLFTCFLLL